MWTIKNRPAMFSNINTKWSGWCITPSLNYKNTMSNRITMETVASLRSKCLLKQNLIPSWPWSFGILVAFPISGPKQNTQTKNFVGQPDRHTWQYCRSLWFSAYSVQRISKSLVCLDITCFLLPFSSQILKISYDLESTFSIRRHFPPFLNQ